MKKGYSLIEILVVMGIFAFLGILVSQIITASLISTKKAQIISDVRNNLNYAVGVIERNLRNSKSVTDCQSDRIDYIDQEDKEQYVYIDNVSNKIIFGQSGQDLTNPAKIIITEGSFTCYPNPYPPYRAVMISLTARHPRLVGAQGSEIVVRTEIAFRNIN